MTINVAFNKRTVPNTSLASSSFPVPAWTTVPIDYDVRANDPSGLGRPCRAIRGDTGALVIKDLKGNSRTLQFRFNGDEIDAHATDLIAAGSAAQNVLLLY